MGEYVCRNCGYTGGLTSMHDCNDHMKQEIHTLRDELEKCKTDCRWWMETAEARLDEVNAIKSQVDAYTTDQANEDIAREVADEQFHKEWDYQDWHASYYSALSALNKVRPE